MAVPTRAQQPCPCGSGTTYAACCGPLHRAERQAATPEELMRSRYAAYALGEVDHVWRTWHPRTRPERVVHDPTTTWTGLDVLRAQDDVVEFVASHRSPDGAGRMHEVSRFERRAGRWFYVGPA
ncbi:zinc chelation protein SecC [Marmoricola sp. Leaf446]|nr:zinc chelation protein SecC [Marmoricola sp. Leaf446]